MRNTLSDLNNILFEAIERINDDETTGEALDAEIKRAEAVGKIAGMIIHNGELALKTMEHLNEYGYGSNMRSSRDLAPVPAMLAERTEENAR